MAGLVRYLFLANLFLMAMALFFHLVLAREKRFILNRFVLLSGTFLSLVLPLFKFSWFPASVNSLITIPEILVFGKPAMPHFELDEIQIFGTAPFSFPWISLIIWIYLAGIIISAIALVWNIKKLRYWARQYPMKWFRNLYITLLPGGWSPFSFFGIVFYPGELNKADARTRLILDHERVHLKQKHAWDILFMEVVKVLFFYNPAVYTLKRQMQINHEYIADSGFSGNQQLEYSCELFKSQMFVTQFQFIQGFSQPSFLKRRIRMLMKNKSKPIGIVKYLLLIPVMGGLIWFSACTDKAEQEIKVNPAGESYVGDFDKSKSAVDSYANAIIESDYQMMNKWEKQIKDVAVEMKKTGANDNEVLNFVKRRISDLAKKDKEGISSSKLFTELGYRIEDVVFEGIETVSVSTITGPEKPEKTETEEVVFYIVEKMPEFDGGGLEKFRDWVQQNVRYPDIALSYGISGTVFAKFTIDKEGTINQVKIVRSVDASLDDEVIRVIKSAPAWTPGTQGGEAVNVQMAIPVKFMLQ